MKLRLLTYSSVAILSIFTAFGQAADTHFQVRYVANLNVADAVINATNTGASSTVAFPVQNGTLCLNVYALAPSDASLLSCCSCPVPANTARSLSVRNDILSHISTPPAIPTSLMIKVMASTGVNPCSPSTVGTGANVLATGMAVWATSVHTVFPAVAGSGKNNPGSAAEYGITETAFTPSTLSAAELTRLTTMCGLVTGQNAGFNICNSCRTGALSQTKD